MPPILRVQKDPSIEPIDPASESQLITQKARIKYHIKNIYLLCGPIFIS